MTVTITTTPEQDAAIGWLLAQQQKTGAPRDEVPDPPTYVQQLVSHWLDARVDDYKTATRQHLATAYEAALPEEKASVDAILAKYQAAADAAAIDDGAIKK